MYKRVVDIYLTPQVIIVVCGLTNDFVDSTYLAIYGAD